MRRTILGLLLFIAGATSANAGITTVHNCWPVSPAVRALHYFTLENNFLSVDLPNPQTNGGNATYAACHFVVPSNYPNTGNATITIEWNTDSTDTTNTYCPTTSRIKVIPANGSVPDNSTGSAATTYTGSAQQSTGQYHRMAATVNAVHLQNRDTVADCAPGDPLPCAGADALIWIFWGDCTSPPWSGTNIGGTGAANVLIRRVLISTPE